MSDKDIHVSVRLDKALHEKLEGLNLQRGGKSRLFRKLLRRFLYQVDEAKKKKEGV